MTYHILVWSELNSKSSCGCGIFRRKRGEGSGDGLRWDPGRAGDAAALMSLVKVAYRGLNRANLKFTNLITTTSRVSVRNIIESEREGAKQIASE
jgi:hypothetical protein